MARLPDTQFTIEEHPFRVSEFVRSDVSSYYAFRKELNREEGKSFTSYTDSRNFVAVHLREQELPYTQRTYFYSAVLNRNNKVVGSIAATRQQGNNTMELGWSVLPGYRRHGLATKSLAAHIISLHEAGCAPEQLIALCDANNEASKGVMAKFGLEFQEHVIETNRQYDKHGCSFETALKLAQEIMAEPEPEIDPA